MGESWPPDQLGQLNGVGLDMAQTVSAFRFVPAQPLGLYRIVTPQTVEYAASFGQTTARFDLMSYCGAPGDGDENFWVSPRNWNAAVDKLATGKAATRAAPATLRAAAADAPAQLRAATPSTATPIRPRMQVDARQTAAGFTLGAMQAVRGRAAVVPDAGKAPHVVFRDAAGKKLSDTPMEALSTHVDAAAAEPVTFLRAMAPMPPAGVRSVSIEVAGKPVVTRKRGRRPPSVRTVAVRGGRITAAKRFTLTWRATAPARRGLLTTVDYTADGRRFKRLWIGDNRGRTRLDRSMLAPGRRARFRVTVDDGFTKRSALSKRLVVRPRPPRVTITGVPFKRRALAGQSITLRGQAEGAGSTLVSARRLTWLVGKRVIGRGAEVTVRAPAKGKLSVRLVARPKSGPTGKRTTTITVVKAL